MSSKRCYVKFHSKFTLVDYRSYLNMSWPVDNYLLDQAEKNVASAYCVVTSADEQAVATIHALDWDSQIFGCPCSRIGALGISDSYSSGMAENIDCTLKQAGTRFADVRIGLQHSKLIREFVEHGWHVVDQLNIYFSELDMLPSEESAETSPFTIKEISSDHAEHFFKQNPKLFERARIYNDTKISSDVAELFYTRLMEAKCVNFSGPMCGIWDKNELVGIAIGEVDLQFSAFVGAPFAYLWLIGLSEQLRGKGVGKKLFHAFLNKCREQKITYLEVGTQHDNFPANKLYASCGLSLESQLITLHRWYE